MLGRDDCSIPVGVSIDDGETLTAVAQQYWAFPFMPSDEISRSAALWPTIDALGRVLRRAAAHGGVFVEVVRGGAAADLVGL